MRLNMWTKFYFFICLLSPFLFPIEDGNTDEGQRINVVFRYDDYSSRSSTEMEIKLIDTFQKHNISCTFGVIPYAWAGSRYKTLPQNVIPLSLMKANILRNAIKKGSVEVALHGYSHQTLRERGGSTEFNGIDYNEQTERIAKGKRLLEEMLGTRIDIFIPPWNSYDLNTIRALEKLNFEYISAYGNGDASESSLLKFIPYTCRLLELRDAVLSARGTSDAYPIIVVLFHAYNFLEVNRELGQFQYSEFIELLDWLSQQKDVRTVSINQLNRINTDLTPTRFIINKKLFLLPRFLRKLFSIPIGIYLSPDAIYDINIRLWTLILLFYLSIFLITMVIAFVGGLLVFAKSKLRTLFKYAGPPLLFFVWIYASSNFVVGYDGAVMIKIGLFGICMGILFSFLKLRKHDSSIGVL